MIRLVKVGNRCGGSLSLQSFLRFEKFSFLGQVFTEPHDRMKCYPLVNKSTFSPSCQTSQRNTATTLLWPKNALEYQDAYLTRNKTVFFQSIYQDQILTIQQSRCLNTGNQNSDINQSWVTRFPKSMQSYLVLSRMDRPIGYWLLFLPGAWSISLAASAGSIPNIKLLSLFLAGSVLMRSAGCVINDMWDSDLDKKVARTSTRPIASGEITHFQALVFLAGQLSISLGILLSLNLYSIVLGASSLLLVASYPLMKRITYWPQLALGLTINWGCLLGWSAVLGNLDLSICVPLYVAAVNWTIFYDTIYAFQFEAPENLSPYGQPKISEQDVEDDRWVGVKSTALLFGDNAKQYLTGFAAIMVASLVVVGINTSQSWPYYLGLTAVASHLVWQIGTIDLSKPKDCLSKFKSNKWLGIVLWMSIIMGTLWKSEQKSTRTYKE